MVPRMFAIAALLGAVTLSPSTTRAVPWEVGGLLGIQLPDEQLTGSGSESSEFPPTIGPRVDVFLSDYWGIYADGLFTPMSSSKPTGDATLLQGRGGVELLFPGHPADHQFFFEAGLGAMNVDLDDADSFSRPFWSFGIGKRWAISDAVRLRALVRGDRTLGDNDDAIGSTLHNFEALLGIAWAFGADSPRRDSDGDGVWDDDDRCPDTPRGATVDSRGCPSDTDGDGVYDGIDQCPDTPKGVTVDSRGCPKDSDGDGVFDGVDECPDTPRGATVDARGCPSDSDGDGVYDGIDQCPNTPKGVEVDDRGCPRARNIFQDEKGEERQALILEGVNFEFNSARLTPESSEVLDRVAESLVAWPEIKIEVAGHTDTIGAHDYNVRLSQRRAESVRAYLASKGVAEDRMTVRGYGPDEPIASNDTEEGRAKNRRVELKKK